MQAANFHTVSLPYGEGDCMEVAIPLANFVGAFSSRDGSPVADPVGLLRAALESPIESPPLREVARAARRVLLIVEDHTRRTPVATLMPCLMEILAAAGRRDDEIRVLFATGTHRAMTDAEMTGKIGREAFGRFACRSHDYLGDVVSLGTTRFGTPVEINPWVAEADLRIAIGSILPHAFCGWSGGGKMILPGVCSASSILATHLLPHLDPEIGLGVLENRARTEIDEAAGMAGLEFIVNAVLNASGEIVDLVAGRTVPAHRAGIARARKVQGVAIPEADLVIGCAHPEDANYWQAGKSLHTMERVVRPGGMAVLVARLGEGRGEHPGLYDAMGEPEAAIVARLERAKESDFDEALALSAALADRKILRKARLGLVSEGLPFEETAGGAFLRFRHPNDAVRQILAEKPDARIACLLNAPEILPVPHAD